MNKNGKEEGKGHAHMYRAHPETTPHATHNLCGNPRFGQAHGAHFAQNPGAFFQLELTS